MKSIPTLKLGNLLLYIPTYIRYMARAKKSVRTFLVLTGTSSVLWKVLPRVLLSVLTVQLRLKHITHAKKFHEKRAAVHTQLTSGFVDRCLYCRRAM